MVSLMFRLLALVIECIAYLYIIVPVPIICELPISITSPPTLILPLFSISLSLTKRLPPINIEPSFLNYLFCAYCTSSSPPSINKEQSSKM